jgi:hypothetical protein
MKRLRLIGLGARLATAGGRSAWTRLGLMAIGFMIGSTLLLCAGSIVPGVHARDERNDRVNNFQEDRRAPDALRVWSMPQSVGNVDIRTAVVEPVGTAPPPPGLSRVPGPGEIFVSDRVAKLWPGLGPTIERRMEGHLAGTIEPDGVPAPDDLLMWVGKPADVHLRPADAISVTGFGSPLRGGDPNAFIELLAVVVASCAILLPIWLFVATVTRLSAATRATRLAAVRLAGATEAQVHLLAATEAGVAAAFGTWLGVPLFLAIRPLIAAGAIGGIHLYANDLNPPLGLGVMVVLGLPALAIAMSVATLRRLVVSPLGVARHVRTSHAGWRWLLVLGAGLGLLAWIAHRQPETGSARIAVMIGVSLVCLTLGLVGTSTWSAWAVARRLAGSVRSVAAMLGLRRLEAEPSSVSRVVGGIALMIAILGVVQSGLLSAERAEGPPSLSVFAMALHGNEVGVFQGMRGTSLIDLRDIPGVRSVRWTRRVGSNTEGGAFAIAGQPIGVIDTDGASTTLEAIRDRLSWTGADIHTLPQLVERARSANDDYSSIRRAGLAITVFLLLVSAATLLVAMVDWLMERRRSIAVLSAIGVTATTVRRSILAQVALPLACSVVFGATGAVLISTLLYRAANQPVVLALGQILTVVGVVVLVVLGVTVLSAPWLRIARRPELLREG